MPPASPKIYHITHVNNLPSIIAARELISDAAIILQGGPPAAIGMSKIKQRRLGLSVNCHQGDFVGDYVPFTSVLVRSCSTCSTWEIIPN